MSTPGVFRSEWDGSGYRTDPYENQEGKAAVYGACMEQVGAELLPNDPSLQTKPNKESES